MEQSYGIKTLLTKHEEAKVIIGFGEEVGTGDVAERINPMIDGLTTGTPNYDGVFVLRNPENCNIVDYALKDIPIFLVRKLKSLYDVCMDFKKLTKKENIKGIIESETNKVKDLEITPYLVDSSNFNTYILHIKDKFGKSVVISGDFKNYDGSYGQDKLNTAISIIKNADVLIVEGKYLGKHGLEFSSGKEILEKLRNIMKFYKQVFVLQSETDLIMASNIYQAALKTKKIFVESSFLCNLATIANGSCPSPFSAKKVYSYNPLVLENMDFEFKKKYVVPFSISSALTKMKKGKYVMNVTKDFLQDIQILEKERAFYDACIIVSEWKGFMEDDKELEDFMNVLKSYDMVYYELYTHGQVYMNTFKEMIYKLRPKVVIPLDFSNEKNVENQLDNFKVLKDGEQIKV